jgi:nitrogen regulatory protein P-II 1
VNSLVVLVLAQPDKLWDVLQTWRDAGVAGATVIESAGMSSISHLAGRDDLPLFPSLRALSEEHSFVHNTILAVVDSDDMIDKLVAATQAIVGDLTQPERGILFAVPVTRGVGYRPRQDRWA